MIYHHAKSTEKRTQRYTNFVMPTGLQQSSVTTAASATERFRTSWLSLVHRNSNVPAARSETRLTTATTRSRQVATQALLYISAFLLTVLPDSVATLSYIRSHRRIFWINTLAYSLLPLQGFWNSIIYIRLRKTPNSSYGRFFRKVICCLEDSKFLPRCMRDSGDQPKELPTRIVDEDCTNRQGGEDLCDSSSQNFPNTPVP
jgi:hypothetical protein